MNRRQKIIISVVGIFIVLLALVGLTYAYFLTQVKGNTNNKSISVTTANLRLVYGGDDGSIIGDGEIIEPDTTFAPKTFTVTNEGNAKVDLYAVVIENFGVYYNEDSTIIENNVEVPVYRDDVTTLARPQDFEIVIECENQDGKKCTGYSGALPTKSAIMLTNSIEKEEVQTYTATLTYKEAGTNQSADMNKRIEGKFNIIGLSDTVDLTGTVSGYSEGDYVQTNSTKRVSAINPDGSYKILGLEAGEHKIKVCAADPLHPEVKDCADEDAKLIQEINIVKGETASGNNSTKTITITEDSREATVNVDATAKTITIESEIKDIEKPTLLVDAIINRAKSITESDSKTLGYAMYSETLRTTPGQASAVDESLLLTTEDDYTEITGNPSYYFRGNVKDNFVNFAGMCWRIIRIAGDESTKLLLEDQYTTCDDTETEVTSAMYSGNWNIGRKNFGYTFDSSVGRYTINYLNEDGMANSFENSMATAFENFQLTKLSHNIDDLKIGDWCLADEAYSEDVKDILNAIPLTKAERISLLNDWTSYYYDAGVRLVNAEQKILTLKCNGTNMNKYRNGSEMKVGSLTADESIYAGAVLDYSGNDNFYLINNYQKDKWLNWLTLTPYAYQGNDTEPVFQISYYGDLSVNKDLYFENATRPAINLAKGTTIEPGGEGTQENPYIID